MIKVTPSGLYVHVPFCRSKCPYCDFYSHTNQSLVPRWMKAIEKEIGIYQHQFSIFDTLYLGGGTPSILSGPQISKLFELVQRGFEYATDVEITIEANPNDLSPKKIKLYRELGINRISLGVQSFDDQALLFLRRRHTVHEAQNTLEWIRKAGFNNLGIDLIYGLPGQTKDQWLDTLKKALAFQPQHLSCYQLTITKGTLFYGMKEKGQLVPIGEKDEEAFFLTTSWFLEDQGFIHYEISNFAREEKYFSRHNQKYWRRDPYLGLGPSAHSFHSNRRWWNIRSVSQYVGALEEGRIPKEGEEELNQEQAQLEWVSLGLRTKAGLDINQLRDQVTMEHILSKMVEGGFAKVVSNRLVPTTKGFLVADRLPLLFE
jgi:oxygen-independent coproporphyrinogen III oxidase